MTSLLALLSIPLPLLLLLRFSHAERHLCSCPCDGLLFALGCVVKGEGLFTK